MYKKTQMKPVTTLCTFEIRENINVSNQSESTARSIKGKGRTTTQQLSAVRPTVARSTPDGPEDRGRANYLRSIRNADGESKEPT